MPRNQPATCDPTSLGAINARIERLPFTAWHGRVLGVIGAAHLFDSFDALLVAFIAPVLIKVWHLTPFDIGMLFAVGYLGQLGGALAIGPLADRIGRRPALRGALVVLSVLSLACAAAPSFAVLLGLRLIQGVGLGAETPVAVTYMNELAPARSRGRIIFALQCLFTSGVFVAAVFSAWLIPHYGWRAMFVVGAAPLLLAIVLPRLAPESPRWLAANNGGRQADGIVAVMEASAGRPLAPVAAVDVPLRAGSSIRELLSPRYIRRSLSLWLMMLGASLMGMSITTWMPTLYTSVYHLPLAQALRYTSMTALGAIAGSMLGFVIIDVAGRRATFLIGFVGASAALFVLAVKAQAASPELVMALATIGMAMTTALLCCGAVYAAEIYPTRMRATGVGATTASLRVGAVVGPIIVGWLLTHSGVAGVFLFFGLSGVVGAITTLVYARETKGEPLEEEPFASDPLAGRRAEKSGSAGT